MRLVSGVLGSRPEMEEGVVIVAEGKSFINLVNHKIDNPFDCSSGIRDYRLQ